MLLLFLLTFGVCSVLSPALSLSLSDRSCYLKPTLLWHWDGCLVSLIPDKRKEMRK